jgi:hypothetical protein
MIDRPEIVYEMILSKESIVFIVPPDGGTMNTIFHMGAHLELDKAHPRMTESGQSNVVTLTWKNSHVRFDARAPMRAE